MEYRYSQDENYEDYASGRVLYSSGGVPNFPVRLLNEIYLRSVEYSEKKDELIVYDPMCGGGYALTVLGLCNQKQIREVIGSDIDEKMIALARKNVSLLTDIGMTQRKDEIGNYILQYGKESHKEALKSAIRFEKEKTKDILSTIFQADCTKPLLMRTKPDIIFTDVPYGQLVKWQGEGAVDITQLAENLYDISHKGTILALVMDKKQKLNDTRWKRCEQEKIGKRKFEILIKEDD